MQINGNALDTAISVTAMSRIYRISALEASQRHLTVRFNSTNKSGNIYFIAIIADEAIMVNVRCGNLTSSLSSSCCFYNVLVDEGTVRVTDVQGMIENNENTLVRIFTSDAGDKYVAVFSLSWNNSLSNVSYS